MFLFGRFYCTSLTRCKVKVDWGSRRLLLAPSWVLRWCARRVKAFTHMYTSGLALPWLGPGKRSVKDHRHNGEVFTAAPNSMRTLEEIWEKPKKKKKKKKTASLRPFFLHSRVFKWSITKRPLKTGTHRAHRLFFLTWAEVKITQDWDPRGGCFCGRVSAKVVWNAARWVNATQAALFTGAGRALVRSCARLLGLGHAVAHKVIFFFFTQGRRRQNNHPFNERNECVCWN